MDRKWDLVLRAEGGTKGLFLAEVKLRAEAKGREIAFLHVFVDEEGATLKAAFKEAPAEKRLEKRQFKGYFQDETGTDEHDVYGSQAEAKLEVIGWLFNLAMETLEEGGWVEIWAEEFPSDDPDSILAAIYEEENYRAEAWLTA